MYIYIVFLSNIVFHFRSISCDAFWAEAQAAAAAAEAAAEARGGKRRHTATKSQAENQTRGGKKKGGSRVEMGQCSSRSRLARRIASTRKVGIARQSGPLIYSCSSFASRVRCAIFQRRSVIGPSILRTYSAGSMQPTVDINDGGNIAWHTWD